MSVLGTSQIGYFSPDYTAYEQALGLYHRVCPVPLLHRDVNKALMPPDEFEFQVSGSGMGCVLLSNPANPTGEFSKINMLQVQWLLHRFVEKGVKN